ncbi:phosphoglycolate phosphatase [Phaeovulum vinaykumarii]|uniref:Phosphoglycolate phosphatase n=1 Tax=Phaeovulum vinaykumarii TaxID=407234 RepID=A0A1N7LHV4_9RHOB|nr:phosphoglycolate phosphatase [Phaeovulum vinaykumarii]SIS73407.1 phosphoglycolate phosphatase [Phaeovulum vinaykumarii]SOC04683.1 phosphoglycolate phosphatase [Phaeovulum vinaykumarii]
MATIVFDLDGTLIDSAPDIHAASNAVLAEAGFDPLTFDEVRSFVGKGVPHLVGCLLEARGQPREGELFDRLYADFTARYHTAVTLTQPYLGVMDALEMLRTRGHVLGVCTNKPVAPARAVLDHLGMSDYFGAVLGGDSLPVRKPDPEPLLATFAALGGGQPVFVGDSEVDAQTAEAARIPFALYTGGYRKTPVTEMHHDALFDDFDALPELVEWLAWL